MRAHLIAPFDTTTDGQQGALDDEQEFAQIVVAVGVAETTVFATAVNNC
jgi:hypothetical protein